MPDEYAYVVNLTQVVFFVDQCLSGRRIPSTITLASDCAAERFIHHFKKNAEDVEWLPEIARRNWVLVTKDRRIDQRPLEREAIINSDGRAFILVEPNMSGEVIGAVLRTAMPNMLDAIRWYRRPFIFGVELSGDLTPRSDLIKQRG